MRVSARSSAAQAARSANFGMRRAARMASGYNRRMRARNVVTAGFLGVEKKFYDTARGPTNVPSDSGCASGELDPTLNTAGASTPGCLSCPAQGDGPENRDGKRIVAKYMEIKGLLNRPVSEDQATCPAYSKVFVALVLDTQTNGAQLNSEDVFKNITGDVAGSVNPIRNLLFGSRFRILKSEIFDLDMYGTQFGVSNGGAAGKSQTFSWFVPLNNLIINFNAGTTSDVANVIDNSLHLIAFGPNAAVPITTLAYNARLRFMG